MSKPSLEKLIVKGIKNTIVNGKTMFYVSAIKKAYPKCTIHDADIVVTEVDDKEIKVVDLANIKF